MQPILVTPINFDDGVDKTFDQLIEPNLCCKQSAK